MKNIIKAGLMLILGLFVVSAQATIVALNPTTSGLSTDTALVYSGSSVFCLGDSTPQNDASCLEGHTFYANENIKGSLQLDLTAFDTNTDLVSAPDTYMYDNTRVYVDTLFDWEYYFESVSGHATVSGYDAEARLTATDIEAKKIDPQGFLAIDVASGANTLSEGFWTVTIKVEDVKFISAEFEVVAVPLPGTLVLFGLGFLLIGRQKFK